MVSLPLLHHFITDRSKYDIRMSRLYIKSLYIKIPNPSMTKFTSFFRKHSRPSDDSCDTPSISSSSSTLVASNQGSSDKVIEGDRLFEIHTPADGRQIDLDIVAVHGLMGNPYTTWTRGKDPNGKPWISDFLPSQLPHARVFSYGYDSNFVRSSSVAGIPEFAMNLLAWLKLRRSTESERQRPLLFICHSLGGIIVKKVRCPAFLCQIDIHRLTHLLGFNCC